MQCTYSEEPLDEDAESEDETVFACLLQTTVQVQEQHQNEHDQQLFVFAVGRTDDKWHVCAPRPYRLLSPSNTARAPFSKPYGVESLVSPGIEYHGSEIFLSGSLVARHRRIHLSHQYKTLKRLY